MDEETEPFHPAGEYHGPERRARNPIEDRMDVLEKQVAALQITVSTMTDTMPQHVAAAIRLVLEDDELMAMIQKRLARLRVEAIVGRTRTLRSGVLWISPLFQFILLVAAVVVIGRGCASWS